MQIKVGDIVTMKKKHPCGGKDFLVSRTGMDVKLCCTSCHHEIMLARNQLEKRVYRVIYKDS